MVLVVLAGFIAFLVFLIFNKFAKGNLSWVLAGLPLSLFAFFFAQIARVKSEGYVSQSLDWVPSLGISLDFRLDGLSLMFALLITGIGTLVFLYTSYYLKGDAYLDRFYAYLSAFMAAMLGLVLSDNLITLFIFWELTSISSFFLIGYKNDDPASRKSALTALSITGLGGLCLLAASLFLGYMGGTYSISALLSHPELIQQHSYLLPLGILVFAAAFTKSAQFPFHFWLPGAMKAPTPVSTYLHSATMVKAGIYLLLRLSPLFSGWEVWHYTLWCVGGLTMLYAAIQTLMRDDLKSILAYSTISALGILVFLIGLGSESALLAALVFILVHALYKATLFLITGILDHATHTRLVSSLGGLGKVMPLVALAGILAAVSNAGIPPSFGFLGKDLVYEAALHHEWMQVLSVALLVLTNILLLFAGFLAGVKPFVGQLPTAHSGLSNGSFRLWAPALLLGILGLFFGLFPGILSTSIIAPGMAAIGLSTFAFELKLWHGFNLVLLLSGLTIFCGLGLYFWRGAGADRENQAVALERFGPKVLIEKLAAVFKDFATFWTYFFQNGYLRNYILVIIVFLMGLMAYLMWNGLPISFSSEQLQDLTIYEVSIVAIMLVAILFTIFTQSRLTAVAALGVVGYSLCLLFVFYSAPDLAMTQFAIDTLTVILFVLVLYRLPKYLSLSQNPNRLRDGLVSLAFGGLITWLALAVIQEEMIPETGQYYAENAYTLAKGKNIVNVILVDFRGLDTLVEITVLIIAALGVFGLMKLRLKSFEKNQ